MRYRLISCSADVNCLLPASYITWWGRVDAGSQRPLTEPVQLAVAACFLVSLWSQRLPSTVLHFACPRCCLLLAWSHHTDCPFLFWPLISQGSPTPPSLPHLPSLPPLLSYEAPFAPVLLCSPKKPPFLYPGFLKREGLLYSPIEKPKVFPHRQCLHSAYTALFCGTLAKRSTILYSLWQRNCSPTGLREACKLGFCRIGEAEICKLS